MTTSHPAIDLDDEQSIKRFTDNLRKFTKTQSVENPAQALTPSNSLLSTHYAEKSTQTELITIESPSRSSLSVMSRSVSPTSDPATHSQMRRVRVLPGPVASSAIESSISSSPDPKGLVPPHSTPERPVTTSPESATDSRPHLQSYEISQIISDAIDNLPPGSLLSLEESIFAPGSKRNLEHRAASQGRVSGGKPQVGGRSDVYQSKDNKLGQTGLIHDNPYAPLANMGNAENFPPPAQKSLIGPGLYARHGRSKPKEIDPDDFKDQVHTYSPGPGLLLKYQTVGKRPPAPQGPEASEEPGMPSWGPSSRSPPHIAKPPPLAEISGAPPLPQLTQLPPHLRNAERSDTIKMSTASIAEGKHDDYELESAVKVDLLETLHIESSAKEDAMALPAIESPEGEMQALSPQFIKENQPCKSTSGTEKLPPHLRNIEKPIPQQASADVTAKAKEPTPTLSPFSDTEEVVAPSGKIETVASRQALFVSNDKPHEFTPQISSSASHAVPTATGASESLSGEDTETNLEGALYFKAWPKSEPRDTPAAEIRRVHITNLPPNATASLVTSLVFGGALEQIYLKGTTAQVLFLHAKDCDTYFHATANGLVYNVDGQKGIAHVAKAADVDVVSGQARTFIELGFTRCVRATGVDSGLTLAKLTEKASYKNRKVESVVMGTGQSGLPHAIFSFCDIRHAVQFKHALERDEEWEDCNIQFSPDPCAATKKVST